MKAKEAIGNFLQGLKLDFGDKIAMELTAGVDSRTTLALLLVNGCKPLCMSHWTPEIANCDVKVPRKIAKKFSLKYLYYSQEDFPEVLPTRQEEYDKQVFYSVDDGDRYVYSRGLDELEIGYVTLRSGIYESILGRYTLYLDSFHGKTEFINQIEKRNNGLDSQVRESLLLWLAKFNDEEVNSENDFLKWFYFSQRNGAWTSYIEGGNDLKQTVTLHPANCGYFMDILNSFSNEKYDFYEKEHQKYIIRMAEPKLDRYKYNYNMKRMIKKYVKNILLKTGLWELIKN